MDRSEARELLIEHLRRFRGMDHGWLAEQIGDQQVATVNGTSGVEYQIEVEILWDAEPGGTLRVLGSIDDGSLRGAFRPVCEDFLVDPEGTGAG
jgi:hypothetical protein